MFTGGQCTVGWQNLCWRRDFKGGNLWAKRRVGTGSTHIPPSTSYGESVFPPEVTVRIGEAHRANYYEAKT